MVELVDALRSGRSIRKDVPVRVRPSALDDQTNEGERWHLPSFPFFVSMPLERRQGHPMGSAPKRGGSNVIRERGDAKDVAQRHVGSTPGLVNELGGAGHLVGGRFRERGTLEQHAR